MENILKKLDFLNSIYLTNKIIAENAKFENDEVSLLTLESTDNKADDLTAFLETLSNIDALVYRSHDTFYNSIVILKNDSRAELLVKNLPSIFNVDIIKTENDFFYANLYRKNSNLPKDIFLVNNEFLHFDIFEKTGGKFNLFQIIKHEYEYNYDENDLIYKYISYRKDCYESVVVLPFIGYIEHELIENDSIINKIQNYFLCSKNIYINFINYKGILISNMLIFEIN